MKWRTRILSVVGIASLLACSGAMELAAVNTHEDAFYEHNDRGVDAMQAGLCDESINELNAAVSEAELGKLPETELATALDNLGLAHKRCAHFPVAEASYGRSLEIRERVLPKGHSDLGYIYNNLAGLHFAQGRYTEAEALFQQAFDIWNASEGPDDPITLKARRNVGMALLRQGKATEAEVPLRYSLERCRMSLGDHRDTASSLDGLGQALASQDRFAEAEVLSVEALEMRKRVLNEGHPVVGIGHGNVADLLIRQERWTDAEPHALQALTILEAAYGEVHNDVATNAFNLAIIQDHLGKDQEAEQSFRRALDVDTQLFGADSEAAAIDRDYLATFLESRSRTEEAAKVRAN